MSSVSSSFLVPGPLPEWRPSGESWVFPGAWCRRDGEKGTVLGNPWNDRDLHRRVIDDLEGRHARLLPRLAAWLDALHGTEHGTRFWRILSGSWLRYSLQVIFERDFLVERALEKAGSLRTWSLSEEMDLTPAGIGEGNVRFKTEGSDLLLFSLLLEARGIKGPEVSFSFDLSDPDQRKKRIGRAIWDRFVSWYGHGTPVALCELPMPERDAWKLARAIGRDARLLPFDELPNPPAADLEKRKTWNLWEPEDDFESRWQFLFRRVFPRRLAEGFQEAFEETERRHPDIPEIVLSSGGWHFKDPFLFFAARSALNGARLIGAQHGGGFGSYAYHGLEQHERQVVDRFFSWGGASEDGRVRPLPSWKLSSPKPKPAASSEPKAWTLAATSNPPTMMRFQSMPTGDHWDEYIEWQRRFIEGLSPEGRERIILRPVSNEYGRRFAATLAEKVPGLRIDGPRSFSEALSHSELLIVDNNSTTLLQAIAWDYPVLAFWDPSRWELRPEAQADFDLLREARLLHDDPESAARHLVRIEGHILDWWREGRTRDALDAFKKRHAKVDAQWEKRWSEALAQERATAAVSG